MFSMSFSMLFYSSLSSLSIFITITLNSLSDKLLASISFSSFFLESSPILSFGACFFVSSFWLSLCVCFYVLDRSAMTSRLGRVALYIVGVLWDLVAQSSHHLSWVPWECPLCGLCVVIESWLLLARLCVGSTLRLTDCEAQPRPSRASCCADHRKKNLLQQDLVPAKASLWKCCLWSLLVLLWHLKKETWLGVVNTQYNIQMFYRIVYLKPI